MKWVKAEYLEPEVLYNTWFELDQPIIVVFHNEQIQTSRDFIRQLEYLMPSNAVLFGKMLVICMHVTKEDEPKLIREYKVNRYPALIFYDGRETGRINDIYSTDDLGSRLVDGVK
jgi:hypothetical protein